MNQHIKPLLIIALLASGALVPGCDEGVTDAYLAEDEEAEEESDALVELRTTQSLRFRVGTADFEVIPFGATPVGNQIDQLALLTRVVQPTCEEQLARVHGFTGTWTGAAYVCPTQGLVAGVNPGWCQGAVTCSLEKSVCELNVFAEIAGLVGPRDFLYRATPTSAVQTATFQPLSIEDRALVLEFGHFVATLQVGVLGALLTPTNPSPSAPAAACNASFAPGLTYGGALTAMLEEWLSTTAEVARAAASAYADLAETQPSRWASRQRGAAAALELRGHAARMLVGPVDATSTQPRPALCADTLKDPQTLAALSILRTSGVSPARVRALPDRSAAPLTLLQLLTHSDIQAGQLSESVILRYLVATNDRTRYYNTATGLLAVPTPAAFLATLGLEERHFDRARRFLANEYDAYRRDLAQLSTPLRVPSNIAGAVNVNPARFAATTNPPGVQSWLQYALPRGDGYSLHSGIGVAGRIAQRVVSDLLDEVTQPTAASISRAAGRIEAIAFNENRGSLRVTAVSGTSRSVDFLDASTVSRDRLRIALNKATLQCATIGNTEGEPCKASDRPTIVFTSTVAEVDPFSLRNTSRSRITLSTSQLVPGTMVYLLEQLPGTPAGTIRSYRELGAVQVPAATVVATQAVIPALSYEASQYLQPNPEDCSEVRSTCTDLSGPLPLEDSLTDDGNQVESSWNRYLLRAREAADRADEYGRRAVDVQLDVARRAEGSIEALQQLCGSTVNLSPVLDFDIGTVCPTARTPLAVAQCLATRFDDAGLDDLVECLDSQLVRDFVSVGSRELCVWHPPGNPRDVCGLVANTPPSAVGTLACPREPSSVDQEGGAGFCVAPAGHVGYRLRGRDLLGVFAGEGSGGGEPDFDAELCDKLRSLRGGLANVSGNLPPSTTTSMIHASIRRLWGEVMQRRGLLALSNLERVASTVSWAARPGGYSSLTGGQTTLIRTGDLSTGPSNSGVCRSGTLAFDPERCDAVVQHSLFCSSRGCDNNNLAAAATTLRLLGQQSLTGFTIQGTDASDPTPRSVPSYFENYLGRRVGRLQWNVITDVTGVGYCSDTLGLGWPSGTSCDSGPFVVFHELGSELPFGPTPHDNESLVVSTQAAARLVQEMSSTRFVSDLNPVRRANYHVLDYFLADGGATVMSAPYDSLTSRISSGLALPVVVADIEPNPYITLNLPVNARRDPTWSDVFDALEVACEAGEAGRNGLNAAVVPPIDNITVDDLPTVLDLLRRGADDVESRAEMYVLTGVPESVAASVRGERLAGITGSAGEYGAQSAALEAAMVGLHTIPVQIASELRTAERAIRQSSEELQILALQSNIDTRSYDLAVTRAALNCANALINAVGANFAAPGAVSTAALVCAGEFAILAVERKNMTDRLMILASQETLSLIDLEGTLDAVGVAMNLHAVQLRSDAASLDTALTELESVRRKADRELAKLLFLDSDSTGAAISLAPLLRNRLNVEQARYQRAKLDAIRMAYLARRAIEQRFGVNMNEMRQGMTLVPPPATWASSVCGLEGVNYGELAGEDEEFLAAAEHTSPFIGDYVTLLENFVDSYRLDYPFSDGVDTAVVSLRDDVAQARAYCPAPSGNLLYHSRSLIQSPGENAPGWEALGCDEAGAYGAGCIGVAESSTPPPPAGPRGAPVAEVVTFAPVHPLCPGVGCPCVAAGGAQDANCGWRPGARWGQWVRLPYGDYRMSWYELQSTSAFEVEFDVLDASGTELPSFGVRRQQAVLTRTGQPTAWRRVWFDFAMAREADVFVGFGNERAARQAVTIAGPMLEAVSPNIAGGVPGVFGATADNLLVEQPVCEDTNGIVFRDIAWTPVCLVLCGDGFEGSCLPEDRREHCYQEMSFDISHDAIEQGGMLSRAGFAYGNFNYRIDSIAVNLVGTGVRDCSNASLPSTCYNNGTVPFTLIHRGPHEVRAHDGGIVYADVFPATIEHGRALATERYLTNPLSGADSSQISSFQTTQFRGRPITGSYTIRISEEDGVNFNNIEDVQVVMGYRYWTRSN